MTGFPTNNINKLDYMTICNMGPLLAKHEQNKTYDVIYEKEPLLNHF